MWIASNHPKSWLFEWTAQTRSVCLVLISDIEITARWVVREGQRDCEGAGAQQPVGEQFEHREQIQNGTVLRSQWLQQKNQQLPG